MAVTEIPWGDGSGDKIYLTYSALEGDQTVLVSSDANTGAARSKVVSFNSAVGSIVRQLTVSQDAGTITPVFYNYLKFDGIAYINTNYVLPSGCSVRCTLGNETMKASQSTFSATGGGGVIQLFYGGGTNSTRRQMLPYYDSASYLASNRYLAFSYATFNYFMTSKRQGWGNSSYTFTKGSSHPTGGLSFGYGGTPYTGVMGTFYVYGSETQNLTSYDAFGNYTPVATFRPCTYNGEAGMWYVEGNTFFGNTAGAGTLTATNTI